jgi:hypothetical protein
MACMPSPLIVGILRGLEVLTRLLYLPVAVLFSWTATATGGSTLQHCVECHCIPDPPPGPLLIPSTHRCIKCNGHLHAWCGTGEDSSGSRKTCRRCLQSATAVLPTQLATANCCHCQGLMHGNTTIKCCLCSQAMHSQCGHPAGSGKACYSCFIAVDSDRRQDRTTEPPTSPSSEFFPIPFTRASRCIRRGCCRTTQSRTTARTPTQASSSYLPLLHGLFHEVCLPRHGQVVLQGYSVPSTVHLSHPSPSCGILPSTVGLRQDTS